mgnify:CR=1 FL=1
MKITAKELRQIIKEELNRLQEDPFADLDAAVRKRREKKKRGAKEDEHYPEDEAQARKYYNVIQNASSNDEEIDLSRKHGFASQRNKRVTFKKKGGGTINFNL